MKIRELKEYLNSVPEQYLNNEVILYVEELLYDIGSCNIVSKDLYCGETELLTAEEYENTFEEIPDVENIVISKGSLLIKNETYVI